MKKTGIMSNQSSSKKRSLIVALIVIILLIVIAILIIVVNRIKAPQTQPSITVTSVIESDVVSSMVSDYEASEYSESDEGRGVTVATTVFSSLPTATISTAVATTITNPVGSASPRTTRATTPSETAATSARGTTPRGTGNTVPNANPTNVTGVTGGATEATTPKPTATPTATPKPTATPTPTPIPKKKKVRLTMEIGWSDEFKAFLWSKGVDPATVARPTTTGVVIYDRDGNAIDTTDCDSAVAAMESEAEAITVQYGYVDEYGYSKGGYSYAVSDREVLETYPN